MAQSEKAKWTRLASLGLVMVGMGPTLMLLAVLAWGLGPGEDTMFFLVTMAIAFVAAFLVWRFGTWSKIVGILAGILLAMALFWTAFGLGQPRSFFDFIPGLLVIPGALITIGASIAALVSKRRGRHTSRAEGGEKVGISVVLGVVVLAAVVSGAMNLLTRSTASPGDAQVRVSLRDFEYDREQYEVAGGAQVFVSNDDPFHHTFTVDELGVDEGFVAGSSKVIQVPDQPGTYILYCRPHTANPEDPEEGDMAATITVT